MFVLDSHCDTPSQILSLRDLSLDNELAHVDYPKLKKGNVDGAFFALYIPASMDTDDAKDYLLRLMGGVKRTLAENPDKAALTVSMSQALENKKKGLFSLFLGLENGSPLGDSEDAFENLQKLYNAGVRYITLCHSTSNQICDSCASTTPKWNGLSPFGKRLVAEMNRIGMLVDVSHISDSAFYDVLACSTKPVVATHSSCRALADHPRNMTDDMIRELAARGGVIQINFYPVFLDSEFAARFSSSGDQDLERPSYKLIADHIDHVVSLVGVDYVGIGSDYDGIEITPDGMEDISMMPKLFDELRSRGYSEEDLEKIAGGNFFRVMEQVAQV